MYLDLDKYPDGAPYYELEINKSEDKNSPGHYFHKPCFIILNLAVGGHFTGIVGEEDTDKITALNVGNNYEARMYIDYIRVYQKGDNGEMYAGPAIIREISGKY